MELYFKIFWTVRKLLYTLIRLQHINLKNLTSGQSQTSKTNTNLRGEIPSSTTNQFHAYKCLFERQQTFLLTLAGGISGPSQRAGRVCCLSTDSRPLSLPYLHRVKRETPVYHKLPFVLLSCSLDTLLVQVRADQGVPMSRRLVRVRPAQTSPRETVRSDNSLNFDGRQDNIRQFFDLGLSV